MADKIKLIAMDMDGTLLTRVSPGKAVIPEENLLWLRRAYEAGVMLALASGRMPDDAGFFALDAGLPMHIIGLNGGMTLPCPGGDPIAHTFLPVETAHRVLDILLETGVDVAVFGAWEVVSMRERPLEWAQLVLGTWFGRKGGRLTYRSGGEDADRILKQAAKIVALTDADREGLAAARERIRVECPDVEISSSWWNNFEVNPAGVNKGTALTQLAAKLGIPMSQVMAIGDNDNDIPMLRAAGIGVAMGNGTPEAKAAADLVTLSNEDCGVAAAIRTAVFGSSIPVAHQLPT